MSQSSGGSGNHLRVVGALAGVGSGECIKFYLIGQLVTSRIAQVSPSSTPPLPDHFVLDDRSRSVMGMPKALNQTRLQCSPPGTYRGALDCLLQTVRNEVSLQRPSGRPHLRHVAFFIAFPAHTQVRPRAVQGRHPSRRRLGRHRLCPVGLAAQLPPISTPSRNDGGRAGDGHAKADTVCTRRRRAFLATPMELLKVKLQLQLQNNPADRQFKGPVDCARKIAHAHGVRGLWAALPASLIYRSHFFWMFGSFEVRTYFTTSSSVAREPLNSDCALARMSTGHANFLSGGLASLVYWVMAIPTDNVKKYVPHRLLLPPASHSRDRRCESERRAPNPTDPTVIPSDLHHALSTPPHLRTAPGASTSILFAAADTTTTTILPPLSRTPTPTTRTRLPKTRSAESPSESLAAGAIDLETFQQILDLDEDDTHDFSKGMVWAYFSQAASTFVDMDSALCVLPPLSLPVSYRAHAHAHSANEDLSALSTLGHFLKGSSAALGVAKVQASCTQIQHFGQRRDEDEGVDLDDGQALEAIRVALGRVKVEYAVAERWLRTWYREHGGDEAPPP
ncbi:hypothetical protein EW146_g9084 [Bondarzewia mesenterica]|uniref:HPt domain-containing protein n=1 Tax=Bondarzewia mesenterica TaxID=1095465 RepID=A0A4S4L938_9AGAM|nr:hypothetical protein EW146_g9084 [Bondarzewia mesenterica]